MGNGQVIPTALDENRMEEEEEEEEPEMVMCAPRAGPSQATLVWMTNRLVMISPRRASKNASHLEGILDI